MSSFSTIGQFVIHEAEAPIVETQDEEEDAEVEEEDPLPPRKRKRETAYGYAGERYDGRYGEWVLMPDGVRVFLPADNL